MRGPGEREGCIVDGVRECAAGGGGGDARRVIPGVESQKGQPYGHHTLIFGGEPRGRLNPARLYCCLASVHFFPCNLSPQHMETHTQRTIALIPPLPSIQKTPPPQISGSASVVNPWGHTCALQANCISSSLALTDSPRRGGGRGQK